jgi:hypothetical protein
MDRAYSTNGVTRNSYKILMGKPEGSCIMKSFIFCTPPNVIRMIMLRRVRWAGHVARMGEKRNAFRILVGKPVISTRKSKT